MPVGFVLRLTLTIKKGLQCMSLFKPYRKRPKLLFTRVEVSYDDLICEYCKFLGHCERGIRSICVRTAPKMTELGGKTYFYSYVIKSKSNKK